MKTRILTDGLHFRVQHKSWGWNFDIRIEDGWMGEYAPPVQFKTHKEALTFLQEKYGTSMELVRTWRLA